MQNQTVFSKMFPITSKVFGNYVVAWQEMEVPSMLGYGTEYCGCTETYVLDLFAPQEGYKLLDYDLSKWIYKQCDSRKEKIAYWHLCHKDLVPPNKRTKRFDKASHQIGEIPYQTDFSYQDFQHE